MKLQKISAKSFKLVSIGYRFSLHNIAQHLKRPSHNKQMEATILNISLTSLNSEKDNKILNLKHNVQILFFKIDYFQQKNQ